MERKRPENIPGYVHPESELYSKDNIYKTFTEGLKPKKKEKFGNVTVGKQYASSISFEDSKEEDELCPACFTKAVNICNCVYSDKTCKNGHIWYTARGDGKPKIGNPHKR